MGEIISNPLVRTYGIPFAGVLVIGLFYWLATHGRRPKPDKAAGGSSSEVVAAGKAKKPVHDPINVRLYDSVSRSIYNTTLEGSIPDDILKLWRSFGRKWLYDNKWVFAINKYQTQVVDKTTGEITLSQPMYRPVESQMSPTRDNPPSKVHRALTQPEIEIFFNVTIKKGTLEKLVPVLIFAGGVVFVMFMWSQS